MNFLQKITPREYQEKIFATCTEKNCLVVLPTGLGKTLIAIMLAIHRMTKHPGQKVLFLAPTKPLAEQHLSTFKKYLPELFAEMNLFTGAVKADQRKKIWQNADIIFSTPQCIANDLQKELYSLHEVCLLVEDEAHRCVKNYDYNAIAQKYKMQAENPRVLALTASPGSDPKKIKQICKNLAIEEVELRTRESEDVKQYLQELEIENIKLDFPAKFEEMRHVLKELFNRYCDELRNRKVLFGPSSKTELIKVQKNISATIARGNKNMNYFMAASVCGQAIKIQHALELLETQTIAGFNKYLKQVFDQAAKKQSKGVVRLVAKPEFNFVYTQSNELLAKNQEHPKLIKIVELVKQEEEKNKETKVIIFTQFRETAAQISKRLNELPNIKSKVFIGQASGAGGVKGLTQKQQKEIIEEFSESKINVLVATCIAEEGLDIPEVNSVIFYEPIPSAIRSIQRRGRTARLMKGKLFMLITKNTRDETFYYVSRSREKKMQSTIQDIRDELAENNGKFKKIERQGKL
jgi:ERCC4-related helicase